MTLHYIHEVMECLPSSILLLSLTTFLGIILSTQNVYISLAKMSHPIRVIFLFNDSMMKCIALSLSLSCESSLLISFLSRYIPFSFLPIKYIYIYIYIPCSFSYWFSLHLHMIFLSHPISLYSVILHWLVAFTPLK